MVCGGDEGSFRGPTALELRTPDADVAQQAEVVERLDDDVEASRADVDSGYSELTRAHERIRGNRALYLKIFGIVGALTVWTVMF